MANNKPIQNPAIVGKGVIGASWAGTVPARRYKSPQTTRRRRRSQMRDIDALKDLHYIGLSQNASRDHMKFTPDVRRRCRCRTWCRRTDPNGRIQDQALRGHGGMPRLGRMQDHRIEFIRADMSTSVCLQDPETFASSAILS